MLILVLGGWGLLNIFLPPHIPISQLKIFEQ